MAEGTKTPETSKETTAEPEKTQLEQDKETTEKTETREETAVPISLHDAKTALAKDNFTNNENAFGEGLEKIAAHYLDISLNEQIHNNAPINKDKYLVNVELNETGLPTEASVAKKIRDELGLKDEHVTLSEEQYENAASAVQH